MGCHSRCVSATAVKYNAGHSKWDIADEGLDAMTGRRECVSEEERREEEREKLQTSGEKHLRAVELSVVCPTSPYPVQKVADVRYLRSAPAASIKHQARTPPHTYMHRLLCSYSRVPLEQRISLQ